MARRTPIILACAATLAGCSAPDADPRLSPAIWEFSLIDGQRPQSSNARIEFEGRKIAVMIGCNHMEGPWRLEDEHLVAGPLTLNESSCIAPAWDQEQSVGALMVATPRITINGDSMTLQSSGHTAELVRSPNPAG